jgi:hypothetical protein
VQNLFHDVTVLAMPTPIRTRGKDERDVIVRLTVKMNPTRATGREAAATPSMKDYRTEDGRQVEPIETDKIYRIVDTGEILTVIN